MRWGYCKAGFGGGAAFVRYNMLIRVQIMDGEGRAGGGSRY